MIRFNPYWKNSSGWKKGREGSGLGLMRLLEECGSSSLHCKGEGNGAECCMNGAENSFLEILSVLIATHIDELSLSDFHQHRHVSGLFRPLDEV